MAFNILKSRAQQFEMCKVHTEYISVFPSKYNMYSLHQQLKSKNKIKLKSCINVEVQYLISFCELTADIQQNVVKSKFSWSQFTAKKNSNILPLYNLAQVTVAFQNSSQQLSWLHSRLTTVRMFQKITSKFNDLNLIILQVLLGYQTSKL
ncbi:Hypothetical_protein [Hexamita inflata]|uniref:Hypothetical_protein n=1 Tax=Hexamita inflata TaxID=28002 RepID=A0AA86RNP6_9EUKA|nr:Hypothetical protein HINF_LOCUS65546 [Hexamita inflata]CAI9977903.1 Hypothetical protein HINF_LOCUS65548 [Hexamita inflata]